MKKGVVLLGVSILLSVSACSKDKTLEEDNIVPTNTTTVIEENLIKGEYSENLNISVYLQCEENELNEDILLYLDNTNNLVLYNISQQKEISRENICSKDVEVQKCELLYSDEKEYIVCISSYKPVERDTSVDGLEVQIGKGESYNAMVYVMDKDLEVSVSYDVMELFPEVIYDLEWSICTDGEASKFYIAGFNLVYMYDIQTKQCSVIDDEILDQVSKIVISEILVSQNGEKIAFYGSELNNKEQNIYGVMNLVTNQVTMKYSVNSQQLFLHKVNDFVYITDSEDPSTKGASGIIICIDFTKDTIYDFYVDNMESMLAKVSKDQKYLITGTDELEQNDVGAIQLKLYNFETGKIVWKTHQELEKTESRIRFVECQGGRGIVGVQQKDRTYKVFSFPLDKLS